MVGWPHFGWGWLVAVAAAVLAMCAVGLAKTSMSLWQRILVAMLAFVGAYMIVLTVLSYYGVGV